MRILGKPLQGKSHSVIALHVHLPGERLEAPENDDLAPELDADDGEDRDVAALNDEPFTVPHTAVERPLQKSMLEAYYKLCRADSFARDKKYMEIPEFYR